MIGLLIVMLVGEVKYRSDIDGLRALAVLPVILFHAGASWIPGGFVGVDIFFVISGYLISSIMLRDLEADKFSFLDFYERRIRRIIPALVVMLLVTVAAFQFIALPDQAKSAAASGLAALMSASNFYFWRSSGYFAPSAELMPLLHTWSLAVEMQFYLLFPIFLLALYRLRLPLKLILVASIVAAFALNVWLSESRPSVAYYLLPSRIWELAVGAAIAAGVVPAIRGPALRQAVPAIGVGLILFSIFYIRKDMAFPGWVALLPCLGAAMILHADGTSWIARRFLATRPLVFVGLLSYSLYLWHWPVLTVLRIRSLTGSLDIWATVGGVIVMFVLAWLSWRYVEGPFRSRRAMPTKRMLRFLGASSAALLVVAGTSFVTDGFSARLSEPARIALAGARDLDPLQEICFESGDPEKCRFGNPSRPVTYAIVGDSHAGAIRPAIDASGLMGDAAGTIYSYGACPLLDGAMSTETRNPKGCKAFKDAVWKRIEDNKNLRTVILGGRWPSALMGWLPETGGSYVAKLIDDETISPSIEENKRVFVRSLGRTLDRLQALGLEVIIIGSAPEPGFDVPHAIALARHAGFAEPRGIKRSLVEARAGATDDVLAQVAATRKGVRFLSIWEAFCDAHWCRIERDGFPLYSDDDHLSYTGALLIAPQLKTIYSAQASKAERP